MKYFIEKLPHLKRFQVYLSWEPTDITPQFRFGPRSLYVCHITEEDLITLFVPLPTQREFATTQLQRFGIDTPITPPLLIQSDASGSFPSLSTLNITTRILSDPQTRSLSHIYEKELIRFDCHIDSEDINVVAFQPGSAILSIEITDDKHLSDLVNPVHSIFDAMSYFERTSEYLQSNSISLRNDHIPLFLYHHLPGSTSTSLPTASPITNHYPGLETEATQRHNSLPLGPFRSIKPIPSSDWQDVSEIWFCHNDNVTIAESRRDMIKLQPRDVFIDDSLVILHSFDTIPIQPTFYHRVTVDEKGMNLDLEQHDLTPLQTRYLPPFISFPPSIDNISQLKYRPQFIPLRLNHSTKQPEPYSFPPDFFQSQIPHNIPPDQWSPTRLSTPFHQPANQQHNQTCNHSHDHSYNHHHSSESTLPFQLVPLTPLSLFIQSLQTLLNYHHNSPSAITIPPWAHFLSQKWYNIVYKLLLRQEPFIPLSLPIHHQFRPTSQFDTTNPFFSTPPSIGEALFALSLLPNHSTRIFPDPLVASFQHLFETTSSSSPVSAPDLDKLVLITCFLFHNTFTIEQLDIVAFYKCSLEGRSTLFHSILPPSATQFNAETQPCARSICDLCCRHHPEHCHHAFPYPSLSRSSPQFQALSAETRSLYPISPYYNIFHMYSFESVIIAALLKLSHTKLVSRFLIIDYAQTVAFYISITSTQIYLQNSNTPRSEFLSTQEFRQLTMSFYPAVKVQYHYFHLSPQSISPKSTFDPSTNLKLTSLHSFQPLFSTLAQQSVPVNYLHWDTAFINTFAAICAIRRNELPHQLVQRHLDQSKALSSNRSLADIHAKTAAMLAKLQVAHNQLSQQALQSAITAAANLDHKGRASSQNLADLITTQLETTYLFKPILPKATSLREE